MKLRGPPLWLLCDVFCWIGLLVSLISFSLSFAGAVQRMLAQGRRRLHQDEVTFLASLGAEQEAWLAYAITRRSFKLAGIPRELARLPHITPARTQRALVQRGAQTLRDHANIDRITRRRARRLVRLIPPTRAIILKARATPLPRAGEAQHALSLPQASSGGGPAYRIVPLPAAAPVPHQTEHAEPSALASLPRSGEESGRRVLQISGNSLSHRRRAGLRVRAPPWRIATPEAKRPRLAVSTARPRAFV